MVPNLMHGLWIDRHTSVGSVVDGRLRVGRPVVGGGEAEPPLPVRGDAGPIGDHLAMARFLPDLLVAQPQGAPRLAEPPPTAALRGSRPIQAGEIVGGQPDPDGRGVSFLLTVDEAPATP